MKKTLRIMIFIIVLGFIISGCNKPDNQSTTTSDDTGQVTTSQSDSSDISSETSSLAGTSISSSKKPPVSVSKPPQVGAKFSYKEEKYLNNIGTRVNVPVPGTKVKQEWAASIMKDYKPDNGLNGPTGNSPEDVLYILLSDHTDDHGGRYSTFSHLFSGRLKEGYRDLLDEYPRLKIGNQFGGNFYNHITFFSNIDPVTKRDADVFRNYLQDPRSEVIGGTWSQPFSAFLSEELAVLNFQYGMEAISKFTGKKVEYYAYSENTGFSYLPQILNGFGFKGAIARTHWQVYGGSPSYREYFGYWWSPDGSVIKTIPTHAGDNMRTSLAGMNRSEADVMLWTNIKQLNSQNSHIRRMNQYYAEKKKQGHKYVIATVVEDARFSDFVPRLMKAVEKEDPENRKYKFVTAEELFSILKMPDHNPVFDMNPNEWNHMWNSGYFGNSLTVALSMANHQVDTAEKLTAFLKLTGQKASDNRDSIDSAWKNILTAEAHDAHLAPGTTKVSMGYLSNAVEDIADVKAAAETQLNLNIDTKFNGKSIIVYNTQSYDRKEPVIADFKVPKGTVVKSIKEANSGAAVPFDYIGSGTDRNGEYFVRLAFVADIPGFGHNTYNVTTGSGSQGNTLVNNSSLVSAANSSGATINGKGIKVVLSKDGLISISLANGTKIIDAINNLTGRFYRIDNLKTGKMYSSSLSVKAIEEGRVLTRIRVEGSIYNQKVVYLIGVYKDFGYIDYRIEADMEDVGIGNAADMSGSGIPTDAEVWSENNDNTRYERLCLNITPNFQYGNSKNEADAYKESYNLHDPKNYNAVINVSRYTPFYPERFYRANERNTLNCWPVNDFTHIYDINSRYFTDFSDTQGSRGFLLINKGNAAYTYDGNYVKYVMGQSTMYSPINESMDSYLSTIGFDRYRPGEITWEFRIVPHAQKLDDTRYTLGDGTEFDAMKAGVGYNYPLYISQVDSAKGSLPPKYRYLLADTGRGTIASSLKWIGNNVYIRCYEYTNLKWGTARFTINTKAIGFTPVSMDMKKTINGNKYLGPYRIETFRLDIK